VAPAAIDCKDCSESYCHECNATVHTRGKRTAHTHQKRLFVCQRCVAAPATVACGECSGKTFCDRCNSRMHGPKGKHKKHQPTIKPVAEYFNLGDKPPAVNKDEENSFSLRVNALVASPQRFSRSAGTVDHTFHDAKEAATETITGADGQPLSAPPQPDSPDGPMQYVDPETHRLLLGTDTVAERVWGWRRLPKLTPDGALFDTGSNKALRTTYAYPKPHFPSLNAYEVAEAVGGLTPEGQAVSLQGLLESVPRFPSRPDTMALNEQGMNLALLAVALAGSPAPLARLFHSVEHRAQGMYSLQFFDVRTHAEVIRDEAEAAGMPVTDQSPARSRETAEDISPRRDAPPTESERCPREQLLALLLATGDVPNLRFLRDLFAKRSIPVVIDDVFPIGRDGKLLFGLTDSSVERWKAIVEKGYAKLRGSYSAIEHANPVHVLQTLTGGRITAESWAGSAGALALFPNLEACTSFVWWRVHAAKKAGQLCWFTHRREATLIGTAAEAATTPQDDETPATAANDGSTATQRDEAESSTSIRAPAFLRGPGLDATPVNIPTGWGTAAWAETEAAAADISDAAIAIHTAELTVRAANSAGLRCTSNSGVPPEGWQLVKLHQLGGDIGAERFSYAHFSGQWTKELRDHFDFKNSDSDVAFATPEDIAEAYDTVTCCSGYVGAPLSASVLLPQAPSAHAAQAAAAQILVVLRPGARSLTIQNCSAFDLRRSKPLPATSSLKLQLYPIEPSALAFLSPRVVDADAAKAIAVAPVLAVNVALGISEALPDQFLCRSVGDTDIGAAYVLTVRQAYHTDALCAMLSFSHDEVAFMSVL
jgi:hypothetical protein